jgi:hypothetical protein
MAKSTMPQHYSPKHNIGQGGVLEAVESSQVVLT